MLLLWIACADERSPREGSDVVEYDGYVFAGPSDQETLLGEGTVTFLPDGGDPVEATQPFEDYVGYWRAELPADVPYTLRMTSPTGYPAVWRGTSPRTDGAWFSGALFGGDTEQVDTFLGALELPATVSAESLADGDVAHLWGLPWIGEGWDCALLTVNGAQPLCYYQDPSTGFTSRVAQGPLSYFIALNLPPGDVVVDSGIGGAETYPAQGGDIVYAFWFTATGEGG